MTIDNIVIPFERLANIRVSSSFSGLGTSGVCRQTLTADIFLDGESFSQGAECVLTDSEGKFKFPNFYINTRRKKGNVLSISAIDRTVYLGQMFDYTAVVPQADDRYGLNDGEVAEDSVVLISSVMSALYTQCGFSGISYSNGAVTKFPYSYIKGKSCQQIAEGVAAMMCGFWTCDSSNKLVFRRWSAPDSVLTASAASEIVTTSEKGPITRVVATNNITKSTFDTLGSTDFMEILKVSADYLTAAQASAVLSAYKDKMFYGWSAKAELNSIAELGGDFGGYPIGRYTMVPHFNGLGAELGASDFSESEFDYIGEISAKLSQKLGLCEIRGNVTVSENGLELVGRYD